MEVRSESMKLRYKNLDFSVSKSNTNIKTLSEGFD